MCVERLRIVEGYLKEDGYSLDREVVESGISEYYAHGGRGDNQDIADFIEHWVEEA